MYKILLVDDERIIMEGIQSIIESFDLGFRDFLIVEDGKYALEIIDQYKPDIIFSDIRMPYVGGIELIRQIRDRKDALSEIPIVIVSGYSDFNYAKTAIGYGVMDYLLKPIGKQELYDILVKITGYLKKRKLDKNGTKRDEKSSAFLKILRNEIRNKDETEAFFNSLNANVCMYEKLQLIEISEVGGSDSRGGKGEAEEDIFHIGNAIQRQLKDNGGAELVCSFDYVQKTMMLFGIRKTGAAALIDLADICGRIWAESGAKTKLGIYISSVFEKLTGIHAAYEEIRLVSRYRKLMPHQAVIAFDHIRAKNREGTLFSKEIQIIVQGIENGNLQKVMEQFNRIREYVLANNDLSVKYIENIYKCLFMEIHRHFYSLDSYKKHQDIFDRLANSSEFIDACNSYEELHAGSRGVVLAFFNCFAKGAKNEKNCDNMIDVAKKLMEENYSDPFFSLQGTADKLHISSSYLSTIFKKNVGISFNEYLCKIRISRATELLKNDSLSVYEIGKSIGYTSEKHFFTVFRKYTGLPPAKYRSKTFHNVG